MKQKFRDVIIEWDEEKYPNLLSMENVIYKLTFPDNKFYIGECKNINNRVFDHSKLPYSAQTLKDNYIRKYKTFKVDILYQCKNHEECVNIEPYFIHGYAKQIYNLITNKITNYKSYSKHKDIINQVMLNQVYL